MTTDPKPVELTESEQRALFTAFTEDSITALRDVIETAKADAWAAARREALLEAERLGKVVHDAATDLLNISAYLIRASYHEDADRLEQALRSGSARGKALRDRLRAALAEPERDEEGGR